MPQCFYVKRNGSEGYLCCKHERDHGGPHEDGYDTPQLTPQDEWMPQREWVRRFGWEAAHAYGPATRARRRKGRT